LQGKLLVAFLLDALLETAERISPWGYRLADDNYLDRSTTTILSG
jgi:hypothetical protein